MGQEAFLKQENIDKLNKKYPTVINWREEIFNVDNAAAVANTVLKLVPYGDCMSIGVEISKELYNYFKGKQTIREAVFSFVVGFTVGAALDNTGAPDFFDNLTEDDFNLLTDEATKGIEALIDGSVEMSGLGDDLTDAVDKGSAHVEGCFARLFAGPRQSVGSRIIGFFKAIPQAL